ncbi:MAG: flagellar hook protein FlgE [Rhizobiales bacterium]|nr:flagellar hook protein FlgE [Hyphomicrobiales bacterium]
MSLYGMMRTGVSGMAAQANRLSTVADNIANSSTTGYKKSKTEFSSLIMDNTAGTYNSGGVNTTVMNQISQQGLLQYTTSSSDLAVKGNGFFVVTDGSGQTYMTRAGAFVPNSDGELVNAAGYKLMAYSYANGDPAATVNGAAGLETVIIKDNDLTAIPSTAGLFKANLPAGADVVAGATPSGNGAGATYTAKSSLVTYDNLGNEKLLDVYFTKTGSNTWEMSVFDQSAATATTTFPYTGGALATTTLTFDATTGKITSPTNLSIPIPDGQAFDLDISQMSQLGSGYTVLDAGANGNPPSAIKQVSIDSDGTIYAQFENGSSKPLYKIPLAYVTSPDLLTSVSGNVYTASQASGLMNVGFADSGGLGKIVSGALENSTVDIADELTTMIESQRNYTANSKTFQTSSDLMDVIINLKR